jgi:hypothetical protein
MLNYRHHLIVPLSSVLTTKRTGLSLPVVWLIAEKGVSTVSILDHGTEAGFYC